MNFKKVTVKLETVLGENEDFDKSFFEYLDEYSIEHRILEKEEGQKWPTVEYTGGPVSIGNMLKERFGYSEYEISDFYQEIKEENNE